MIDTYDFVFLSLGAGVQSSALLVMSALGLHGCPHADCAVFADTQGEPSWVYKHLDELDRWAAKHGLPIYRVTAGNLAQDLADCRTGRRDRCASIPAWTAGADGRASPLWRQCTQEYKIRPIHRFIRQHLGYEPHQKVRHRVACLLGISLDEGQRAKASRFPWIVNAFPLIDAAFTRFDCAKLLDGLGLPVPRKSACVFCPYHADGYWRDLKQNHPHEFARAAAIDREVRDMSASGVANPVFLHRSLTPLDELQLSNDDGQLWFSEFAKECDGMCGV